MNRPPKRHLDQFSRYCGAVKRQTHSTDHMHATRPNNNNNNNNNSCVSIFVVISGDLHYLQGRKNNNNENDSNKARRLTRRILVMKRRITGVGEHSLYNGQNDHNRV